MNETHLDPLPRFFPLTLTHLRFTAEATTSLHLDVAGYRAGSALRGAVGEVMKDALCTCPPHLRAQNQHLPECYVGWLFMGEKGGGDEARPYSFVPPLTPPAGDGFAKGQRFDFYVTLYGQGQRFLPHFLISVNEAGQRGLGYGRGQFAVRQVWAVNPFADAQECVLAEGESVVRTPTVRVTHDDVLAVADETLAEIAQNGGQVRLNFITPTRLIDDGRQNKAPDFGVLFQRLLFRLDMLSRQHCGGQRRDEAERLTLQAWANQVRLAEDGTRRVEVFSGSRRTGHSTPLSGFVGMATYRADMETWQAVLPWLLWGQATQVGKSTVKGDGLYEVEVLT
jgi:hypothetical protein